MLTLTGVAGSVLAPGLASPAGADQISDKRAQAARLAKQIEAQGERVSVLAEQVDQATLEASKIQASLADAKAQLDQATKEAAAARALLTEQAVQAYLHGGAADAAPDKGDLAGLEPAVAQQYLHSAEKGQVGALDAMRAANLHLDEERARLEAAQKRSSAALAKVQAAQKAASKAQADAEATLSQVKGDLASLVAEEQAREAAAAQARSQAQAAALAARARSGSGTASRSRGDIGTAPTGPAPPVGSGAAAAVAEAKRQLGKPYSWGAAGPDSFDCSGLTMWAWRAGGRSLPHSSQSQYASLPHVSMADIQPGDLVFFGHPIHHVGIYVGGGTMIDAPHSGAVVRYAPAFRSDFVGAARP